ncbi:MAG: PQQ-dependent sugar dehydrogenase, partial [Myxococcales bacterium]
MRALLVSLALLATTVACASDESSPDEPTVTGSTSQAPTATPTAGATATSEPDRPTRVINTIARGLKAPWGIAFLPDGSALVTERDSGRVLRVTERSTGEVGTIGATQAQGEAGLLGIAVSPDFATNRRVFVYVTTAEDNRVLSVTFDGRMLRNPTPILTGIPSGFIHDGGRLAFGPDGGLYVSTGETGEMDLAQDPDSL